MSLLLFQYVTNRNESSSNGYTYGTILNSSPLSHPWVLNSCRSAEKGVHSHYITGTQRQAHTHNTRIPKVSRKKLNKESTHPLCDPVGASGLPTTREESRVAPKIDGTTTLPHKHTPNNDFFISNSSGGPSRYMIYRDLPWYSTSTVSDSEFLTEIIDFPAVRGDRPPLYGLFSVASTLP